MIATEKKAGNNKFRGFENDKTSSYLMAPSHTLPPVNKEIVPDFGLPCTRYYQYYKLKRSKSYNL